MLSYPIANHPNVETIEPVPIHRCTMHIVMLKSLNYDHSNSHDPVLAHVRVSIRFDHCSIRRVHGLVALDSQPLVVDVAMAKSMTWPLLMMIL